MSASLMGREEGVLKDDTFATRLSVRLRGFHLSFKVFTQHNRLAGCSVLATSTSHLERQVILSFPSSTPFFPPLPFTLKLPLFFLLPSLFSSILFFLPASFFSYPFSPSSATFSVPCSFLRSFRLLGLPCTRFLKVRSGRGIWHGVSSYHESQPPFIFI